MWCRIFYKQDSTLQEIIIIYIEPKKEKAQEQKCFPSDKSSRKDKKNTSTWKYDCKNDFNQKNDHQEFFIQINEDKLYISNYQNL